MAAMMLTPSNALAHDAKTCGRGCCGGKNDYDSVKHARRAARRREARHWKREVATGQA